MKLALIALGLLLGVLFIGKVLFYISRVFNPLNPELNIKKQYSWDGKSAINLSFKSPDSTGILNYDPSREKTVILNIPQDTFIEVPRGFGSWAIGSVYDLGQEENPPLGALLLKDSVSKLVGLPVDGIIIAETNVKYKSLSELIFGWRESPFNFLSFFNSFKTSLSPIESVRLYQALSKVRSDRIISLDLGETDITKSKLLGDSSRVLGFDGVNLDLFVRENMSDEKIIKEALTVGIYNGTSHPGLAQEVARIITNLGGDPVIITNNEVSTDKTLILGDVNSQTYRRFAQAFAPHCLTEECKLGDNKLENERSDLSIIIGEDYFRRFHQR